MNEPIEQRLLALAEKATTIMCWTKETVRVTSDGTPWIDSTTYQQLNPDTIVKLCRVVQAARNYKEWGYPLQEESLVPVQDGWVECWHLLDEALSALDGAE